MLLWRFGIRQSGEFCIGCNWIPCYCIRYRNVAILSMDHWVVMLLFCSSRIVHPYRRNQPRFQVYTSVCPRGARREKPSTIKTAAVNSEQCWVQNHENHIHLQNYIFCICKTICFVHGIYFCICKNIYFCKTYIYLHMQNYMFCLTYEKLHILN